MPGAALAGSGGRSQGGADLSVQLSASPKLAQPGQPLIYRVDVRNAGPEDAVLPLLTIQLPQEVEIIHVDVAECRKGTAANEVVCPSQQDVLAGGTGGVMITGLVDPDARGPLQATATLSSEVEDENEEDNISQAVTSVDEGADLVVRLSRKARAGRLVTMDAVVRNRGPRVVRDAALFFDTRSARFLSAKGAPCHSYPGHVGCTLHPVASGKLVKLKLAFHARRNAPQAKATVYSVRVGDRRPANNLARISLR
ncbi:hypothetical protein [Streptosporangium sp. NPDC000396]|uniref:hypothetical protein n=1 Tax=Streptosporangium sp. NPDC000396 TaxID=3366185 RepID=UPI00368468AE